MTGTHDLKTWPAFFADVLSGHKTFEVRRNDRDYRAGDLLRLREWSPDTQAYTGRETVRRVTYTLDSSRHEGVAPGHVVMGIAPVAEPSADGDLERKVSAALYLGLIGTGQRDAETLADHLVPVVVRLIEEERAERDRFEGLLRFTEREYSRDVTEATNAAIKAETAIARVRALHAPVPNRHLSTKSNCAGCQVDGAHAAYPCSTLAALDGTETTR